MGISNIIDLLQSGKALDSVFTNIVESLKIGDEVTLTGSVQTWALWMIDAIDRFSAVSGLWRFPEKEVGAACCGPLSTFSNSHFRPRKRYIRSEYFRLDFLLVSTNRQDILSK